MIMFLMHMHDWIISLAFVKIVIFENVKTIYPYSEIKFSFIIQCLPRQYSDIHDGMRDSLVALLNILPLPNNHA